MLICLEAQAVTTADLGQEHGILARLQFSLILRLIDLTVDQCCCYYYYYYYCIICSELVQVRFGPKNELLGIVGVLTFYWSDLLLVVTQELQSDHGNSSSSTESNCI